MDRNNKMIQLSLLNSHQPESKESTTQPKFRVGNRKFYCGTRLSINLRNKYTTFLTLLFITIQTILLLSEGVYKLHVNLTFKIVVYLNQSLILFLYFRLIFSDPGIIQQNLKNTNNQTKNELVMIDGQEHKLKFCITCKIDRQLRTHHCSICNVCIMELDHHCPWISNCIGFQNRRSFVIFLILIFIQSIFVLFIKLDFLLAYVNDSHKKEALKNKEFIIELIICIFNFFVLSAVNIVVIHLLTLQIYLIAKNMTFYEHLSKSKKNMNQPNIFSKGIGSNCFNFWFYQNVVSYDDYFTINLQKQIDNKYLKSQSWEQIKPESERMEHEQIEQINEHFSSESSLIQKGNSLIFQENQIENIQEQLQNMNQQFTQ